jgi:hypothetical protein
LPSRGSRALDRELAVRIGLSVGGAYVLAAARRDANAEAARWQAWWTTACGDQSPRRIVVADKPVCQVLMEQAAGK